MEYEGAGLVLIPLNSGLVFTCEALTAASTAACLNPFEFRAGIYFQTRRRAKIRATS